MGNPMQNLVIAWQCHNLWAQQRTTPCRGLDHVLSRACKTLWYIFFVWDHEKKQFNSKKGDHTQKKTTILYVFIKYESQWAVISLFILLNRAIEWRVDLPNSWEATKREAPETEPLAELCLMEFLLEHIGHPSPMDLCSHRKGSWPAVWV